MTFLLLNRRFGTRRQLLAMGLGATTLVGDKASAQLPPEFRSRLVGQGKALLVGVSRYDQRTEWNNIPSIERNTPRLEAGLRSHFATIEKLPNPTHSDLLTGLRRVLLSEPQNGDERILIYYAGHGYADYLNDREAGYLTGRDSYSNGMMRRLNPETVRQSAVAMVELDQMLRRSKAGQVLVVLDCCNSGAIFSVRGDPRISSPPANSMRDFLDRPIRFYLTAGDYNQRTPEDSPIWRFLLAGLSGAADADRNGIISTYELGNFVRTMAISESENQLTPRFAPIRDQALSRGDFLFISGLNQSSAPAPPSQPGGRGRTPPVPFAVRSEPIARTYLIHFDVGAATMLNRSIQIAALAAENALAMEQEGRLGVVEVVGQSVSEGEVRARQRANTVAASLRSFYVPANKILVRTGTGPLLVPTSPGAREPYHREVQIILKSVS
jgi:hypothetical protein